MSKCASSVLSARNSVTMTEYVFFEILPKIAEFFIFWCVFQLGGKLYNEVCICYYSSPIESNDVPSAEFSLTVSFKI